MSGQGDEAAKSGTTTKSTDTGLGSASLLDPFVAILVPEVTTGLRCRIRAPEGFSVMEVQHSTWVAAARSKSVLWLVVEEDLDVQEPFQSCKLLGSTGNMAGLQDTINSQLIPSIAGTRLGGRKRSASGAAPGSVRYGHNPNKLASVDDFPLGHFDEPNSDDHIQLRSPRQSSVQLSPMRVDPDIPADIRRPDVSPISSTISLNLLLKSAEPNECMPSPQRHPSTPEHSHDSNKVRTDMEGLIPVGEGFKAPGYVPVGNIAYKIHSPRLEGLYGGKSDSVVSTRGRSLFVEHTSMVEVGPHDPPVVSYHPALHVIMQNVHIHSCVLIITHT